MKFLSWIRENWAAADQRRPAQSDSASSQPEPVDEPTPPPLLRLPQEMIDLIVSFLNTEDAACLSLCNKALLRTLDIATDKWSCFRMRRDNKRQKYGSMSVEDQGSLDQRRNFLNRLSRDWPAWYCCHRCSRLHRITSLPQPSRSVLEPCENFGTEGIDYAFEHIGASNRYRLTFDLIRLAVATSRRPRPDVPLEFLSRTSMHTRYEPAFWSVVNVSAVISKGELLMRAQQWMLVDLTRLPAPTTVEWCMKPHICRHLKWHSPESVWNELMLHADMMIRDPTCDFASTIPYKCNHCEIEAQIHCLREKPGSSRAGLIVTKYLNVGSGTSFHDQKWRRHLTWPRLNSEHSCTANFAVLKSRFEDCTSKPHRMALEEIRKMLANRKIEQDPFRCLWPENECAPM